MSAAITAALGIAILPATARAQIVNAYGGANPAVVAFEGNSRLNLFAAGDFTSIGGVATPSHVARFNGFTWAPVGTNVSQVTAMALAPNGDLVTARSSAFLTRITPAGEFNIGSTAPFAVGAYAVLVMPGGEIVAGGTPRNPLATTTFPALRTLPPNSSLPMTTNVNTSPTNDKVLSLMALTANTALVGGSYSINFGGIPALQVNLGTLTITYPTPTTPQAQVAPFVPALPTTDPVTNIIRTRNGDTIVCTNNGGAAGSIFRLSNSPVPPSPSWGLLGTCSGGVFNSIRELPDGDLIVGGSFTSVTRGTSTVSAAGLARLQASGWTSQNSAPAIVRCMTFLDDAEFAIGGSFSSLAGTVVNNIAALRTPNPPSVKIIGSGCVGPGGLNALANNNNPFLNRPFALIATGMAPNSLALLIQGLTPTNVQLPAPMQQGCLLFTSQDLLTSVPVLPNGTAPINVAIPDDPALLGAQRMLFQFSNFDVGITNITTSNALSVRFGDF